MRISLVLKEGLDPNATAEQIRRLLETNTGRRCSVRMEHVSSSLAGNQPLSGVRRMFEETNARNLM